MSDERVLYRTKVVSLSQLKDFIAAVESELDKRGSMQRLDCVWIGDGINLELVQRTLTDGSAVYDVEYCEAE